MKRNLLYTMALALIIGASANAQSRFVPEDDIYYQPKESNPIVEKKKNEKKNNIIVVTDETPAEITIKTSSNNKVLRELDEDEYNRRGSAYLDEITQEVFDDPDIEEATYVNPNEGYYLNELQLSPFVREQYYVY